MAANDDFPRGWQQVNGYAESVGVTYPAIPGISWVLDNWYSWFAFAIAGGAGLWNVEVTANGTVIGNLAVNMGDEAGQTSDGSSDTIQFPVGAALTIAANSGNADIVGSIRAHAYPV